jgi:phosphatidate cytidylyltransferase
LVKEYNLNLIKRSATGFLISLPIIFIALAQNYWIFFTAITGICTFAMYEWVKNNFRHPILWGLSLIFLYFWFSIIYFIGALSNVFPSIEVIKSYNSISIFYLFFIIVINTAIFDTSAYLFGSNFGKTPIAPSISPNKTLEGLIGGLVIVLIYALIVCYFFNLKLWFVPICMLGGFLAFLGDLLISFHKRDKGIKDTGAILPGHGGLLDRIDSHLLATPILLFISIVIESL